MQYMSLPDKQRALIKEMYDCYTDKLLYAEHGFNFNHCVTDKDIQMMRKNVETLMSKYKMSVGDIYDALDSARDEIMKVPEIKQVLDGDKGSYFMKMGRTPAIVKQVLKFKELNEVLTGVQKRMLSFAKIIQKKIGDGTLSDFDPEIDQLIAKHLFNKKMKPSTASSRKRTKKTKKKKRRSKKSKNHSRRARSQKEGEAEVEGDTSSPVEGYMYVKVKVTQVTARYCRGKITGVSKLQGFSDERAKRDYKQSLGEYGIVKGGEVQISRETRRAVGVGDTISVRIDFDQGDAMINSI